MYTFVTHQVTIAGQEKAPLMNTDYIHSLLQEFSMRIGIPSLTFNPSRLCHLVIDHEFPLTLYHDVDCTSLTLIGKIADGLPVAASQIWLEQVLTVALNPITGKAPAVGWHQDMGLIAYQRLAIANLNSSMLETAVSDFMTWIASFALPGTDTLSPTPSIKQLRYGYDRV